MKRGCLIRAFSFFLFHYGKHHQICINNLNRLIEGTRFETVSLERIVIESEGSILNNSAQVWNHNFYFESFSATGEEEPQGDFARTIDRDFGTFDKFREEFGNATATLFGSGWVWLVWEHVYYVDYQNRRPEYIETFWDILNWNLISSRY